MVVLILYINLLNLSWLKMSILRTMEILILNVFWKAYAWSYSPAVGPTIDLLANLCSDLQSVTSHHRVSSVLVNIRGKKS